MRVIARPGSNPFASLGMFINCQNSLLPLLLKPSLFGKFEELGGNVKQLPNSFISTVFHRDWQRVVPLLRQLVEPITMAEFQQAKETAVFEVLQRQFRYQETLPAMLQKSYGIQPLDKNALDELTLENVNSFRERWFTKNRLYFVGIGIDQNELELQIERYFGDLQVGDELLQVPKYSQTSTFIDSNNSPKSPNPEDPFLSHVVIGYPSMSFLDSDFYALSTLSSLLGGGSSFSAGGPGKGMYSRLYLSVMNVHGWIDQCNVVSQFEPFTPMFGIQASIIPDKRTHQHIVNVLCSELYSCLSKCTDEQLMRAKNAFKSTTLYNMESQQSMAQFIAQQAMFTNGFVDLSETCQRIDMIKQQDLVRVAQRVFQQKDIPSRFEFENTSHWISPGKPSVVVHAPFFPDDQLHQIETTMSKWQLS
jgi:processing peptidase subunit alpha